MKENFNFKIVKVMKSMFKTRLNHLLFNIPFNDKYWRSQLDFLHLSIQHNNKGHNEMKFIFKQHFATTFRPLTKTIMVSVYQNTTNMQITK